MRNVAHPAIFLRAKEAFRVSELAALAMLSVALPALAFAGAKVPQTSSGVRLLVQGQGFRAETGRMAIALSPDLGARIFRNKAGKWVTLSPSEGLPSLVSIRSGDGQESRFKVTGPPKLQTGVEGKFGEADRVTVRAQSGGLALSLKLTLEFPRLYPDVAVLALSLQSTQTSQPVVAQEISEAALRITSGATSPQPNQILFQSLQGGGYKWGADYVIPVRTGFFQDNFTGPKGQGNGGGFPFVDLWRPEMGLAVALLDPKPALAWVPVRADTQGNADVHVAVRPAVEIPPGGTYAPSPVMIVAHGGDFYDPVVRYRELMEHLGVNVVKDYEPGDYAPAWCTWGYQRTFTVSGIEAKIPQMQEMGIKDFILDDGWFDRFGDWRPTPAKFPDGEDGMKALIGKVHSAGLTFRLWWSPGSADPGSQIDLNHPDWYILDKQGKREKASWNAYYLCPAYAPVREYMAQLTRRFVKDWKVDSFKIDGTDLNHSPLCFNPAHHHARPEESFEQWPDLFLEIRRVARDLHPGFRVELCPCGITPTFQLATAFEQPTDSDAADYQVTSRVKFLKALFGPRSPVLQEYVGLWGQAEPDGKPYEFRVDLFARAIGTGEVPSTFTMALGKSHADWMATYNRYRPAEGEYVNLYDIGWENPEGHAIKKGARWYYAFFSPTPGDKFAGTVELRGLDRRPYKINNYVEGRTLGRVQGPAAKLQVDFKDALLLVAEPVGEDR